MKQLDPNKLAALPTFNERLNKEYGVCGTPGREQFNEKALAWFYGNMLKERRKELKLTQKELALQLGREQSYIARVENGKTDVQISTFFRIASVLGIQFVPTFI